MAPVSSFMGLWGTPSFPLISVTAANQRAGLTQSYYVQYTTSCGNIQLSTCNFNHNITPQPSLRVKLDCLIGVVKMLEQKGSNYYNQTIPLHTYLYLSHFVL